MAKPRNAPPPDALLPHMRDLHAWCFNKSGDLHLADDVAQDTALTALSRLDTLRNPDRLRRWLFRIAQRRMVDAVRRRPPFVPLIKEPAAPPAPPPDAPERARLRGMIRRLPVFLRLPVRMYYLQGRPLSEVASRLRTTRNAIKARLYRARQRMRKEAGR